MHLRLATRGSPLALVQTELVAATLRLAVPTIEIELVTVTTAGDRDRTSPLTTIGGQGIFVDGVREAVLDGRADAAVHSLKDVPTALAPGLILAAVLERADPRDAFVGRDGAQLADLAPNARVGTSSRRRAAMLLAWRPDIEAVSIRGNVETRLRKVADGEYDGTILAVAGLERLGLLWDSVQRLPLDRFVPSPAQGVIGVECRADDTSTVELLARIDHRETYASAVAERAFLGAQGTGCTLPVGAHAITRDGTLHLSGTLDGRPSEAVHADGPLADAEQIGHALGELARTRLEPSER